MKKILTVLMLLMLAASVFAGGKGQSQPAGGASVAKTEITLQLSTVWEPKAPGLKADFEAAFPQYTLKIALLPIAGYFDNAAVAILAGTAPDVLDIDVTQVSTFANKGLVRDLTQLVGGKLNRAEYVSTAWDHSMFEGKLYGFPSRGSGGVVFYNKTMFDEAGVPYPQKGWTNNDFLAIAQKITVPGVKYGASIAADASDPMNVYTSFCPVLWDFGGDFLSPDGTKCVMNTPEAIQAITFWTELLTKHKVVPEGSASYTTARDVLPLFVQNKVAMMIYGASGIVAMAKNPNIKYGIAQVPGGFTRGGGWALVIPVSVADSKVNAAVDYILWHARADVQAKHNVVDPSNIAAWKLAPPWNTELYQEFVIAANNGKILPPVRNWAEASKIIVTELQNVLLGRKTPQQAGNDMVNQVNPIL